jgi:threonine synthase
MTEPYRLYCPSCRSEQPATARRCAACGGLLAVGLTRFLRAGEKHPFADMPGLGAMWRSNPVLPIADPACIISLGEGGTPCIAAAHLAGDRSVAVWLKNEAANPSGSFKDRQVSVGISHALEVAETAQAAAPALRGPPQFYVVSSGNVAAAAAAYCARAGARLWVIAPASAPAGKLLQVALCGARVVQVESPSAGRLFELAEQAAAEFGWRALSTAARASPFNIVGACTIAAEIMEQMPTPDWIIAPVGGGGLLGSLWQGLQEAWSLVGADGSGWNPTPPMRCGSPRDAAPTFVPPAAGNRRPPQMRRPRLVGVQAAGCAPFVRAVEQGLPAAQALAQPWKDARTIAGGLADDVPFDAHLALPAVIESQGLAIAVSDDEIRAAQRLLAESEGLFIEPSGAVTIAALLRLMADGRITRGETVCCLLTGSGLKDPASVGEINPSPVIAAEIGQLRQAVEKATQAGRARASPSRRGRRRGYGPGGAWHRRR